MLSSGIVGAAAPASLALRACTGSRVDPREAVAAVGGTDHGGTVGPRLGANLGKFLPSLSAYSFLHASIL